MISRSLVSDWVRKESGSVRRSMPGPTPPYPRRRSFCPSRKVSRTAFDAHWASICAIEARSAMARVQRPPLFASVKGRSKMASRTSTHIVEVVMIKKTIKNSPIVVAVLLAGTLAGCVRRGGCPVTGGTLPPCSDLPATAPSNKTVTLPHKR